MNFSYKNICRGLLAATLAVGGLTQCSIRDQVQESAAAPSLHFQLVRIEETSLAGLDAQPWRVPADINLEQRSQVIRAYSNKNVPLRMRLLLAARDPGLTGPTVAHLDYDVLLDERLLGSARLSPNLPLPADGSPVTFPLTLEFNTYKFLGDDALPKLRNFSVGLADRKRIPPRLTLRLRPTLLTAEGKAGKPGRLLLLDPDSTKMPLPPSAQ